MSGWYSDEDKITHDRAGTLTRRYIREVSDTRCSATAKEVCNRMDIALNRHNRLRVRKALEYYSVCEQNTRCRERRFELPEEVPE